MAKNRKGNRQADSTNGGNTAVAEGSQTAGTPAEGSAPAEGSSSSNEAPATGKRRGRRVAGQEKNFVGTVGEDGQPIPFRVTDADSVGQFVTQYGNMGQDFEGGYETHYNNAGPICRKGVERMGNQGKAKTIAIFLHALASDAAMVGASDHGLPARRDPSEAEALITSIHTWLGNLLEQTRNERAERSLAAAAAAAGVSVDDLRALKARQNQTA